MRVLLIKTSSMGDLIHTLPALTDASIVYPDIQFDWVVEEAFAEIPALHPQVKQVIPVSLRRWRKRIANNQTTREWRDLKKELQNQQYDFVLDAQGLMKSAFLLLFTRGLRVGLDWSSARESMASLLYQKKYNVNFYQHAIVRMRSLFSLALNYPLPSGPPVFGLDREKIANQGQAVRHKQPYIVFLHGTTWETKMWPEQYWRALARKITAAGLAVKISGGNDEEMARAKRIANLRDGVEVISRMSIMGMAGLLANATAVVAVDTGFAHFAAALDVPTISLYGPTNAAYTGAIGSRSIQLSALHPCAPCIQKRCTYKGPALVYPACFASLGPGRVWEVIKKQLQ